MEVGFGGYISLVLASIESILFLPDGHILWGSKIHYQAGLRTLRSKLSSESASNSGEKECKLKSIIEKVRLLSLNI